MGLEKNVTRRKLWLPSWTKNADEERTNICVTTVQVLNQVFCFLFGNRMNVNLVYSRWLGRLAHARPTPWVTYWIRWKSSSIYMLYLSSLIFSKKAPFLGLKTMASNTNRLPCITHFSMGRTIAKYGSDFIRRSRKRLIWSLISRIITRNHCDSHGSHCPIQHFRRRWLQPVVKRSY